MGRKTESDGDFLARVGTDGQLWAREFLDRYTVLPKEGVIPYDESAREWQEGVVLTWFANAIEAGRSAGLTDDDHNHVIQFDENGWTIQHPLIERLKGSLFSCPMKWQGGDLGLRGRYMMLGNFHVGDEIDSR